MTSLSGDRTHHTCLLLLNTYSLLMMALPHYYARLWKIIIRMPLHHTLSNLVTSTLVTIFCRLQKIFQNKILTIDTIFLITCCEILLNFIPIQTSLRVQQFCWRVLWLAGKIVFLKQTLCCRLNWNEFCQWPNSTDRKQQRKTYFREIFVPRPPHIESDWQVLLIYTARNVAA